MRRLLPLPLVFLLALFAGGCAHTKPAVQIAQDGGLFNKFQPAAKTMVVGRVDYMDPDAAMASAIVELNRAPYAMGTFLVARDANEAPAAVLETTKETSHNFQAVVIVSGKVAENEEVVEPGPELARLVQENIDSYLVSHPTPTPAKPAETSASTETPAPTSAPAVDATTTK